MSFGLAELKTVPGFLKTVFTESHIDFSGAVEHLVETADRARREGLLSLESHLPEIDNDFMRRGLQLVIDGTDPELTRNMLEMEIASYEQEQNLGVEIFNSAGDCPDHGIWYGYGSGSCFGEYHDPDTLAPAIASAFIATLTGYCQPAVIRLRPRSRPRPHARYHI